MENTKYFILMTNSISIIIKEILCQPEMKLKTHKLANSIFLSALHYFREIDSVNFIYPKRNNSHPVFVKNVLDEDSSSQQKRKIISKARRRLQTPPDLIETQPSARESENQIHFRAFNSRAMRVSDPCKGCISPRTCSLFSRVVTGRKWRSPLSLL